MPSDASTNHITNNTISNSCAVLLGSANYVVHQNGNIHVHHGASLMQARAPVPVTHHHFRPYTQLERDIRVTAANASAYNQAMRNLNAAISSMYDQLHPLHHFRTNQPIRNFPRFGIQIFQMSLEDVRQVLADLGGSDVELEGGLAAYHLDLCDRIGSNLRGNYVDGGELRLN